MISECAYQRFVYLFYRVHFANVLWVCSQPCPHLHSPSANAFWVIYLSITPNQTKPSSRQKYQFHSDSHSAYWLIDLHLTFPHLADAFMQSHLELSRAGQGQGSWVQWWCGNAWIWTHNHLINSPHPWLADYTLKNQTPWTERDWPAMTSECFLWLYLCLWVHTLNVFIVRWRDDAVMLDSVDGPTVTGLQCGNPQKA